MEDYIDFEGLEDLEEFDENLESCEEVLIMAVREKPCLWDQRIDVRLRGLDATKQAWKEISEILDMDPKFVQNKWKNLRDTFRRKHQEQNTYVPSGSAAVKKRVPWKFYQHMEFLLPTIQFRKTFSNLSGCSKNTSHVPEETAKRQRLTAFTPPLSESSNSTLQTELQRKFTMRSSPSPTCTREMTSPLNIPSTPPRFMSPPPSTSSSGRKRQTRSSSTESNNPKEILNEAKFVDVLSEISQTPREERAFCQYLECRLKKLQPKYFAKITNTILLEVMKIEAEQQEQDLL